MTHDPFQTYSAFGMPLTMQNPLATINPLAATQGINPTAGIPQFPQQGIGGIPGYGAIHPQLQLQLAALASQGGPQWPGQSLYSSGQNALLTSILQNPLLLQSLQSTGLLQNPLLQNALLQNQLLQNPYLGSPYGQQQHSPFQQSPYQQNPYQQSPYQQNPYQQIGFGQQLPPQTWIGQAGVHPLAAQFGGRGFQTPGISPWAGF